MKKIPAKSVERICRYRQVLLDSLSLGKEFIYSHELAHAIKASPAQVRRDLMPFNLEGTPQKGYHIRKLLQEIEVVMDPPEGQKVVLIGIGNLGRAILSYFSKRRPNLTIIAAFDTDPEKVNRLYAGIKSHPLENLESIVGQEKIAVGIITVPAIHAQNAANQLIKCGVKGIINFAPLQLHVPDYVFLENIDITTAIEKTAYFAMETWAV
ncbi:MAG: redox-sensing transcriptional repressor Rex [Pseudomonadota bacterium]